MKTLAAFLAVGVIWLIGLLLFADRVQRLTPPDQAPQADGIVALTGGSDARIQEAMELLQAGKGRRVLVSGVNRQVTREQLRRIANPPRGLYECCVDLGFDAKNTLGNAQEIAEWARAKSFHSLIVVTSDYHMPRSLLEIHGAVPEAQLIPYPIATPRLDTHRWWRTASGARIMTLEYCKFLIVSAREALLSLGRGAPKHTQDAASSAQSAAPAR
jgi:uncharacterized SAM-binding protein YcdF (DUF218 family)